MSILSSLATLKLIGAAVATSMGQKRLCVMVALRLAINALKVILLLVRNCLTSALLLDLATTFLTSLACDLLTRLMRRGLGLWAM